MTCTLSGMGGTRCRGSTWRHRRKMEPRQPSLFLSVVESLLFCWSRSKQRSFSFRNTTCANVNVPSHLKRSRPRQQTAAAQPDTNTTTSGFHLVSSSFTIWDRIHLHKQANRLCSCCRRPPPTALSSDRRKTSAITDRSCRFWVQTRLLWLLRRTFKQPAGRFTVKSWNKTVCRMLMKTFWIQETGRNKLLFRITNLELQKRVNALISMNLHNNIIYPLGGRSAFFYKSNHLIICRNNRSIKALRAHGRHLPTYPAN